MQLTPEPGEGSEPTDVAVLIAGGGPAGSACAAALLRRRPDLAGRVVILERAHHPRAKPCGGGLTGHVPQALAALGLRLEVAGVPARRAQVHYGTVRRAVALAQPVVVIRREEFDASLLAQAQALGAVVRQGVALTGFEVHDGAVVARVKGTGEGGESGTVRAQVLVGADGSGSIVRKQILGHRLVHAQEPGAEQRPGVGPRPLRLFRAELVAPNPYGDQMVYDFTPMTEGLRGYLWLFPVPGGRLNVGVMHMQPRQSRARPGGERDGAALTGAELAALCQRHLRSHGVECEKGALRGWPAWAYDPRQPLSRPRILLCGDAAGIDALTGEGIAVALEQGLICGQALDEGLRCGDLRFAGYTQAVRRAAVGRELALDRRLAQMLYDHGAQDDGWRRWLGMVLFDEELLGLYAARVAGTLVLSEHKRRLFGVLLRQLWHQRARTAALDEAIGT